MHTQMSEGFPASTLSAIVPNLFGLDIANRVIPPQASKPFPKLKLTTKPVVLIAKHRKSQKQIFSRIHSLPYGILKPCSLK